MDVECCNTTTCPEVLPNSNSVQTSGEKSHNDSSSSVSKAEENATAVDKTMEDTGEKIDFKVIFNKKKIDVTFALDGTVGELKTYLHNIINVPEAMQKIMIKGLAKDDQTLRSLGVTKGAKVMIVGSKLDDVLAVSIPTKQEIAEESAAAAVSKEPLSQQKVHRKVLDKGLPEDVMPGILDTQEPLPSYPLVGMLNKSGNKVRLTFKLEQDQLWIGTKDRTDKLSMTNIKDVHTEPIHDHPEYHIVGLQLGTTEASRYWIYWVPTQYIQSIKDSVLGKWCYF
ncbi:ubiquitin domain-containing protein UBFD1-like [Copidosoma floridanum]|uniref:ubiquitin domain-containing protein UBFD1-like n=1 Tax=Copidosoma floridanum TaxID=29053 RepID=UPI0006C97993|nr:ubiquitin domain-containing protein UBFD1-like [Copidosoma floridanum]